ncbi:MAG: 3-deoxy-D-manno-octulosonic acid transferase [Paracoccaceae bacterium]
MTTPLALRAYLLASALAEPFGRPVLKRRLRRGKEDPDRLHERLGHAMEPRPGGALIWMHGASVGEAMSMLPLISAFTHSDHDLRVLVTTGTVTSANRIAPLLPERVIHQFAPIDTAGSAKRFLDYWRPDLASWVESELWPRVVWETARREIPMALVNARFSEGSVRAWRWVPKMFRSLLECFRMIRTQDQETVARLGAFDIAAEFLGNLKALIPPPKTEKGRIGEILRQIGDRPVWLAASTHPEDEPVVLKAHNSLRRLCLGEQPLLILAPRHPERGNQIAESIKTEGLSLAQRSNGEAPTTGTDIWLVDTLGEMDLWYAAAQMTLVGGSFGTLGGHTPFEPAMAGSVVLHGPDVANFVPVYAAFGDAGGSIAVESSEDLARHVHLLLTDPIERERMRQAAHNTHEALKPDVEALAHELIGLIGIKA